VTPTDPEFHSLTLRSADGSELVADHLPGSAPPLLFLHGLRSVRVGEKSTALFRFAAARSRAAWRFDFRGHGDSGGRLEDIPLSGHIADTGLVLERSGPAHLIGSSMGGLVAAWTAARHPERVLSLTLLAPAFRFLERHQAAAEGPTSDDSTELQHGHDDGPLRLSAELLADLRSHDERRLAHALRCPLLVAHGELDDVVPVDAARRFVEELPPDGPAREFWMLRGEDHRLNRPIAAILDRAATFHGF
jgi:pimeloyl-ACP methyl ester carboxylesterase